MVFPENEYDTDSSFGFSNGQYTFAHKAYGADMFRYSWDFGQNWTDWANWEDTTVIPPDRFTSSDNFWAGDHIMVQCRLTFLRLRLLG
jgi:alpha-1,3-glucan synthase